jgi:hypothetical protein
LAAILVSAAAAVPSLAAQKAQKVIKGLDDVYIIKSDDRNHAIMKAACKSCHLETDFKFWMLIYGDQEPRVEAELETGKHGAGPGYIRPGRKGMWAFPNSHDYFDCAFCHVGTPSPDDKEKATFSMPVGDLCMPCHPDTEMLHAYDKGNEGAASQPVKLEKLLERNIPTDKGEVLCLSCHQVHNAIYSIRPGYIRAEIAERSVNPHGKEFYCILCHEDRLDDPLDVTIREGGDSTILCSGCHVNLNKASKHHPVGATMGEETWKIGFVNFPFEGDKLTCSTCHDEVCYRPVDQANPSFLREGPYVKNSDFCFRCHTEDKTEVFNPHKQFHEIGLLKPETCLSCHKSVPDTERESTDKSDLIEDSVLLCQKCHYTEPPHPIINHLVPISKKMMASKINYEKKHSVSVPLLEDGSIVCTTCHNPHDKGVLKGDKGVGAGEHLFLRLADYNENCAPCHGDNR